MKATIFTNVAVFTAFVSAYPGFRLWGSPTTPSQAQAQITAPPIARRLFANDTNPPGNYTIPPSNSTTALPTTTRTPQEPTYSPLPYETPLPALPEGYYPTQGVPANCVGWHVIGPGETCGVVSKKYGVAVDDLAAWNPFSGPLCNIVYEGMGMCVWTAGYVSPKRWPEDCNRWHLAEPFDNCHLLAELYSVSSDIVRAWNLAGGSHCYMEIGQAYCVGTASYLPGSGAPGPVQEGQPATCNSWHRVDSGNTCQEVLQAIGLDMPAFYALNPAVGSDCENMWTGYYVCTGTSA